MNSSIMVKWLVKMITINLNEKKVRMDESKDDYRMLNSVWRNNPTLHEHEFPVDAFFDSKTDEITIKAKNGWSVKFNG